MFIFEERAMGAELTSFSLLQKWCREAVDRYGDDWARIEEFVQSKVAELGEADRERFVREVDVLIAQRHEAVLRTPPN
ncbi:MAG: hypothetical protein ABSD21_12750 [Rhizomicrobium sp.]